MASYAVFAELYNQGKQNVYEIISAFVKELIVSKGIYQFDIKQMNNAIKEEYSFDLPDSVVKTSIKKIEGIIKKDGNYIVSNIDSVNREIDTQYEAELIQSNEAIIRKLTEYAMSKCSEEVDIELLSQSFCHFLLDETNGEKYSDIISAFIVSNKDDKEFRDQMNRIKAGVIIYSGLNYDNSPNVANVWKNDIVMFLETEVLFHLAGYHEDTFRNIFEDFYTLVNDINSYNRRTVIKLKFFEVTKNEIDVFFLKAEEIIKNRRIPNPSKKAMLSILNGCKSISDVQQKKTEFYAKLREKNITLDSYSQYYNPSNYRYNIEDTKYQHTVHREYEKEKLSYNLRLLSFVNIRREGPIYSNVENCKYLLITENSHILNLSNMIRDEYQYTPYPMAISLYHITNKLWVQLGKGLGNDVLPTSFDVVTKAQIVLSRYLDESIEIKYEEIKSKYSKNEIDENYVLEILANLREQAKTPEEIHEEEVDDILCSIHNDDLEAYIERREEEQNQKERIVQRNEELTSNLAKQKEMTSEKNRYLIKFQKELVIEKEIRLIEYEKEFEVQKSAKELVDLKVKNTSKRILNILLFCLVIYPIGVIASIQILSWNKVEPIVYVMGLIYALGIIIMKIKTGEEFNVQGVKIYINRYLTEWEYKKRGVSVEHIDVLNQKILSLREEIDGLVH